MAGCGHETLPFTAPVERTPAYKTAIDFARRNPNMSIVRVRPDGRMIEARDRETGRLLLLPEAEVRAGTWKVVPCPGATLLPGPVCLAADGRRAEYWEGEEALAEVAGKLGGAADSAFTAHFESSGWRVYAERRERPVTRVFAVRQIFEK